MLNIQRNIILLFVVVTLSFILGGCGDVDFNTNYEGFNGNWPFSANNDYEVSEEFFRQIEAGNRFLLRLHGINGKIAITGLSTTDSVTIEATKMVSSFSMQDAATHLQDIDVNVQSLTDEVFIETVQPQQTIGRSYVVDYTITLPSNMEIQVNNVNGNITIDFNEKNVSVNNVNGNVTLANIFGSAWINLTNGTIDSEVTLPLNGTIDLNTVNGNIDITIPTSTSAEFSAAVNVGSINITGLALQNEVVTSKTLSGTLGNGQGIISLEAKQTGSITATGF